MMVATTPAISDTLYVRGGTTEKITVVEQQKTEKGCIVKFRKEDLRSEMFTIHLPSCLTLGEYHITGTPPNLSCAMQDYCIVTTKGEHPRHERVLPVDVNF